MTYTSHGHHILGTVMDEKRPDNVARCGGPALCRVCGREAAMARHPASGNKPLEELTTSEMIKNLPDLPIVYGGEPIGRVTSAWVEEEGVFIEFTVNHSVIKANPGIFDSPLSGLSIREVRPPQEILDDTPMYTGRRDPERAAELRVVDDIGKD